MATRLPAHLPPGFAADFARAMERYRPVWAVLYGSHARGDVNEGSDIDLLLVKETDEPFLRRIDRVLDLLPNWPRLEPLVYTPGEFRRLLREGNDFIQTVVEEGITLYGQQPN